MSTESTPAADTPPRATRAQRLVAAGFLGAFGLTLLTVLLTGLAVKAPRSRDAAEPAREASGPAEPAVRDEAAADPDEAELREPTEGARQEHAEDLGPEPNVDPGQR